MGVSISLLSMSTRSSSTAPPRPRTLLYSQGALRCHLPLFSPGAPPFVSYGSLLRHSLTTADPSCPVFFDRSWSSFPFFVTPTLQLCSPPPKALVHLSTLLFTLEYRTWSKRNLSSSHLLTPYARFTYPPSLLILVARPPPSRILATHASVHYLIIPKRQHKGSTDKKHLLYSYQPPLPSTTISSSVYRRAARPFVFFPG